MEGSTLSRTLLLSVALVIAGPAMAQSNDKDPATTKPSNARSPVAKAAAKRLEVPGSSVKPTTTRAPASTSQQPVQERMHDGSHCDHGVASDA